MRCISYQKALLLSVAVGALLAAPTTLAFSVPQHLQITMESAGTIQALIYGKSQVMSLAAIEQIQEGNETTDDILKRNAALFHPEWHFTNEQFAAASASILRDKAEIIANLPKAGSNLPGDPALARKRLGRALHTIQDFYSHGNYVEQGNTAIKAELGVSVLPNPNATADQCLDPNTLMNGTGSSVTTAYFVGELTDFLPGFPGARGCRTDLMPKNKCFHGNYTPTCQGINKDLDAVGAAEEGVSMNPNHPEARRLAVEASKAFLKNLVADLAGNDRALAALFDVKGSLGFLIDTTTSMSPSIAGVTSTVEKIIADVQQDADLAPDSYVLTTFGDPYVDAPVFTSDPQELLGALRSISLHGGGTDCPELTNTGLLAALNASSPMSQLYVFTDATSKDQQKQSEAIAVARAKGIKVTYALTGSCSPIDPSYIRVANETGGQVFRLTPSQMPRTAPLIVSRLGSGLQSIAIKTGVAATSSPGTEIAVDSGMRVLSISVTTPANNSGASYAVQIRKPNGALLQATDVGASINAIESGTIAVQQAPEPGIWRVHVSGSGPYELAASGKSKVELLKFGFVQGSGDIHGGYSPIAGQPRAGESTLAEAKLVGATSGVTWNLINESGSDLGAVSLTSNFVHDGDRSAVMGLISPPNVPFRLVATGLDSTGTRFTRVHPTLFKGQSIELETVEVLSQDAVRGEVTKVPFRIKNHGAAATFALSSSATGNVTAASSVSEIAVAAGGEATFDVAAQVPAAAPEGTSVEVTVSATSKADTKISNTASATLDVVESIPLLTDDQRVSLAGVGGESKLYRMIVPAGAKVLSFITYGGTGDVSVYASQSTRPTPTDYQHKSTRAGNSETVRFMAPAPGTYYVLVTGAKAFSTTLMATWAN
ncbi:MULTISPECIES: pre-peptidase C-terminal domain-containing protein [Xanthomonas]|jgi:hypothetical protein|uniref:pre-peptidase C-terminal domain-containing protein n=1 Tax=Xanthomonas TaxID=338 RepID=UPI001E306F8D|nr:MULTISPECIES: pre-peptidase C-terminal domain-containing protein [Xanthomonas]MCC8669550.1 pre-peptidase C-terminal domain-containing protein [Xanthomonas arboricola]